MTPLITWLGLRHDDWQEAYVLLQLIMQFVTFDVCANLIFPAADAPPPSSTMMAATNRYIEARDAIMNGLRLVVTASRPNLNREPILDNTARIVGEVFQGQDCRLKGFKVL
jgi:hypothetical protein